MVVLSCRRVVSAVAATLLVAGLLIAGGFTTIDAAHADTAPPSGTPATVSADPLPTVQVDGNVYAQVTVGNVVYATGSFTTTWPAGVSESTGPDTPRANLLAYNITTGALVTSFNHSLNAQGLGIAASPDGSTIYVVGDFTTVDGVTANHIAAFSTSTGKLLTGFAASVSSEAAAVAVTSSAVYVGGNFFNAGGHARTRLAAFAPTTGALLSWAPTADDGQVSALAVAPDGSRVIIGGRFSTLDHQASPGIGAVDPTAGTTVFPFTFNTVIHDANVQGGAGIASLAVQGKVLYGSAEQYSGGNFEGTFALDPDTGNVIWMNDCHGDTYSVFPVGQVLYAASHAHDCSAIGSFPAGSPPGGAQRATAFTTYATGTNTGPDAYGWNYAGQPDGTLLDWFPTLSPGSNQDQAAWSITGNANYVAYGGEFPTVNGVAQQGLVRFAVSSLAPNKVGPIATTSSTTLTPTVSSTTYGTVNLSWVATWDRDNQNLTYTVLRDGTAVGTVTAASNFWTLPTLTYADTGLTPGTTHTYRIRVTDPFGNSIGSSTSQPVTVSSNGSPPPNQPPTAAFTSTCSAMTCKLDGSSSYDPDGTIASYAWNFGDGKTGTGVTPTHRFKTGGSHTVSLTVTDNSGATSTPVTHTVTTTKPATVWAKDDFTRNSKSGWGTAAIGGKWSSSGCASTRVASDTGYQVAKRGTECATWLPTVSRGVTDTVATVITPTVSKSGMYVAVLGRRVSARTDIRLRLHLDANEKALALLQGRVDGKTVTLSKSVAVTPPSSGTDKLHVQLQVSGSSRTTVSARVWWVGTTQPSGWTVQGSTSLAALAHRGSVGVATSLPKSGAASATVRFANFTSTSATS